ncbi:ABC transporter thiamine pyrophosphate-binding lipoprotein p37/Cypl [Mycoplasma phocoenae]|uniref:High affinity transport system protein n=1 Tax=Mycoplasma phocoenae TaxID=754517 RepID=A0A858U5X3_9MOLU|nr:hypothetical protein [Mycoplasma phocoenae]QJG66847.1 hypothetical protein HGG69_00690 [Mycoplasma phocoenae]
MKNKYKLFSLLSLLPVGIVPLASVSCSSSYKDNDNYIKNVNFTVPSPWLKGFKKENVQFFKNIEKRFNELKKDNKKLKNKPDIVIDFKLNNSRQSIFNDVLTASSAVSFPSSVFLNLNKNAEQKNIDAVEPILLTTTYAPIYDNKDLFYVSDRATLESNAVKMTKRFNELPYKDWTDSNRLYDKKVYQYFYEPNQHVKFQRGAVYITGDESTLKAIKQAWKNKDWNAFRNFGIVKYKDKNSSSKFLYPEFLFKHHFNQENNKFIGFNEDQSSHNNKYLNYPDKESARNMYQPNYEKFHIFLGEENEFAYHHNSKNKQYFSKVNERVEILTLTDPYLFNVVVVDKNMNAEQMKLLKQSIKEAQDDYGKLIGITGYLGLEDLKTNHSTLSDYIKEYYKKASH